MYTAYIYDTPIGKLTITENGKSITHLYFGDKLPENASLMETPLLKKANQELKEYFQGERKVFNIPVEPEGTEFQKKVWKALIEIPYGETRSYKDIATIIGNDKASRAIGMANNRNPISIIIPCHRVIGSNGKLVGYGGGLDIKIKLLEIEKSIL